MQDQSFVAELGAMEHRNTGSLLCSSDVLNILKYFKGSIA